MCIDVDGQGQTEIWGRLKGIDGSEGGLRRIADTDRVATRAFSALMNTVHYGVILLGVLRLLADIRLKSGLDWKEN
jgi:hypothetical protein